MRSHRHSKAAAQKGVLLLEVLIALLIFALGVLGLIGLQSTAAKESGQAKYRADATLLANDLLGQMWLSDRTAAALTANFGSAGNGGDGYNAWKARVVDALPGAGSFAPTVTFVTRQPLPAIVDGVAVPAATLTPSVQVTITMFWKAPGELATDPPHNIVLVNEIR